MRFLTFNLWHGLSPSGLVAFEALEPTARRELREKQQVDLLRELKPDFCFFQEVNPIGARAAALSDVLQMKNVFQPDLVGTKLFGFGLPLNLNSGLLILAAQKWGLQKVGALSLSRPGFNWVRSWASWQLKEERFALFAETLLPQWGRVLLIDTHIHHGLESTPDFIEKIEKLAADLELPASMITELRARLALGNARREHEIETLIREIERIQSRYEVIAMGGDFNTNPESAVAERLRNFGFRDTWEESPIPGDGSGFTFDAEKNPANHILQTRFPLSLVLEDLTFSAKIKEALLSLARAQEARPRRIDYLWVKGRSNIKVKLAQLVGQPDKDGLAPSDHFGVMVDLEAKG